MQRTQTWNRYTNKRMKRNRWGEAGGLSVSSLLKGTTEMKQWRISTSFSKCKNTSHHIEDRPGTQQEKKKNFIYLSGPLLCSAAVSVILTHLTGITKFRPGPFLPHTLAPLPYHSLHTHTNTVLFIWWGVCIFIFEMFCIQKKMQKKKKSFCYPTINRSHDKWLWIRSLVSTLVCAVCDQCAAPVCYIKTQN